MNNGRIHIPHDFKANGLADWVPIFRAGKQTDSRGRTQEWTEADLDQIVANHSADHPAPHVITHKELYSPFAYAQVEALKREGDTLYAKSRNIEPQFEKLLKEGRLYERSVRLVKSDKGWKLGHIAWLGAEPPAVEGLEPVRFDHAADVDACDFAIDSRAVRHVNLLARMVRNLREFLIAKFDQETADRYVPEWDAEALAEEAARLRAEQDMELRDQHSPTFAAAGGTHDNTTGGTTVSFTQADIDAARAAARQEAEAEFAAREQALQAQLAAQARAARQAEFQAFHDELVEAGHAPAHLVGMTDFMHALAEADAAEFEFSAADGAKQKKSLVDWFRDFAKSRAPDVQTGEHKAPAAGAETTAEFRAPAGYAVDSRSLEIDRKAREYAAAHNTDYYTAVAAVTKE